MSDLEKTPTDTSTSPEPHEQSTRRAAYKRPRKAHITQDAINDLEADESFVENGGYTHDSNITVKGKTPFAGRSYQRARAKVGKLQKSSHYGQYLEIPKGKRSIFISRERARRRNSIIVMALIVLALLVIFSFAIKLILGSAH